MTEINEKFIETLIKKGESTDVDFKLKLNLESKSDKAEFAKDIIALANTTQEKGYLIIGVSNNKEIVGIELLSEEKLQQICYHYISPKVNLSCSLLNYKDKRLGVIEIDSHGKPFEISRDVSNLKQHDVFIRFGTITQKAPTQEILKMGGVLYKNNNTTSFLDKITDNNCLSYYLEAFRIIHDEYKDAILEIIEEKNINNNFKFSVLSNMYDPTRNSKYGYNKRKIEIFYMMEERYKEELKHIRLDFRIEKYPKLCNLITSYFLVHNRLNSSPVLLEYVDHRYKFGDIPMSQMIATEVKKYDTPPEKPGLIAEAINFYNGLVWKIACLSKIDEELIRVQEKT